MISFIIDAVVIIVGGLLGVAFAFVLVAAWDTWDARRKDPYLKRKRRNF